MTSDSVTFAPVFVDQRERTAICERLRRYRVVKLTTLGHYLLGAPAELCL